MIMTDTILYIHKINESVVSYCFQMKVKEKELAYNYFNFSVVFNGENLQL